ncbi:peptidoglycan binding protein, partial [Listeria marthii FSL S4-120]
PIPVPPVPNEPTIPPAKPEVPVTPNKPEPSKKSPISTKVSTTIKLPKTGDTPLVNGWGILLVAISAGGLIALRRK